jgi:hypothetical protein
LEVEVMPSWNQHSFVFAGLAAFVLLIAFGYPSEALCQDVHFGEDAFDKVTFSQMTQLEARQKCEESLQQTVQATRDAVELSDGQREKLVTAGRLDIHRFFSRYEQAKRGIPFGSVRRDRWQQLSIEAHASVRPLSRQFLQGLHGDSSLFDKTLQTMLDAASVSRVKRANEEAARSDYADQIDTAMLVIGRQVRLTPDQRTAIREKLLVETDPPAMFGTSLMPLYFVLANMGDIEDELRGLFNEQDWRTLGKLIEAGRTATR